MDYDLLREYATRPITALTVEEDLSMIGSLMIEAGELAASRQHAEDVAYQIVKTTESETATQMRTDAQARGEKITESLIATAVPSQASVMDARLVYIDAKKDNAVASSLALALRERNRAIQSVAQLVMAGFVTKDSVYMKTRETMSRRRSSLPIAATEERT